jgi:O-methyltransferase involved in polyketide biosynthesis
MELHSAQIQKVHLTGTQATLLIPLREKALDSRSSPSLLHDTMVNEIMAAIDYDFGDMEKSDNDSIIRARHYDDWTKDFIHEHPDAVIVHLGCGLDTRVTRIHPPETVQWFDVDFPDVIELRKHFYADSAGYTMIASSFTDPAWLSDIPAHIPTMIIAEGCLEYLSEDEVRMLFSRLVGHFHHGMIAFDVMSRFVVEASKKMLAEKMHTVVRWSVDDLDEIDALNPDLKRIDAISVFESPFTKEFPLDLSGAEELHIPLEKLRDMIRLVRYEF